MSRKNYFWIARDFTGISVFSHKPIYCDENSQWLENGGFSEELDIDICIIPKLNPNECKKARIIFEEKK